MPGRSDDTRSTIGDENKDNPNPNKERVTLAISFDGHSETFIAEEDQDIVQVAEDFCVQTLKGIENMEDCVRGISLAALKTRHGTSFNTKHGIAEQEGSKLRSARLIYEDIIEGNPENADAWHLLGLTYHMMQSLKTESNAGAERKQNYPESAALQAVSMIDRAIELRPGVLVYRANAVKILRDTGLLSNASAYLEDMLRILDDHDERKFGASSNMADHTRRCSYLAQLVFLLCEQGRQEDSLRAFNRWNRLGRDVAPPITGDRSLEETTRTVKLVGRPLSRAILTRARGIGALQETIHAYAGGAVSNPRLSDEEAELWTQVGLVLSFMGRHADALGFFVTLVRARPGTSRFWFNAGITSAALGDFDVSGASQAVGVALKHGDDFAHSLSERRILPRPDGLTVIAIYCDEYGNSWWPPWGPTSTGTGIGGSEEAVIFMSQELGKLGTYWVEVYAKPPIDDIGETAAGRVAWYPHEWYSTSPGDAPDIFVSWRYSISMVLGTHARQRYLWLQDIGPSISNQLTSRYVRAIDGIFTLSNFHTSMLPVDARSKAHVTPNAMDPGHFVDFLFSKRDEHRSDRRFIYASAPNRGLQQLLQIWPIIFEGLGRRAELWVYYGFTDAFMRWGRINIPRFDEWMLTMQRLLRQEGVNYVGLVDQAELARAYWRSGFALYPTSFPETGCVALMKAQALGSVPITSRHVNSTLPELTGPWDLGPPGSPGRIADDPMRLRSYADAVVRAALGHCDNARDRVQADSAPPGKCVAHHRARMVRWARERFRWGRVARLWDDAFWRDPP